MHKPGFTILFAAAVCFVCAIFVSGSAVLLSDRQERNRILDRREKVLAVAGLVGTGEKVSPETISKLFEENIRPLVVDMETGEPQPEVDAANFDQSAMMADPATSHAAPPNQAKVVRVPNQGLVFQIMDGETVDGIIIPVEGKGLWSTLYGYLALDSDGQTIQGITFYQHGETPGLGGEVDNPRWKSLWSGRKAYDESGEPKIQVIKGQAGPARQDPYAVDGLSGATLTSRGVTHLVQFWLSEDGFGPYIQRYREKSGT